MRRRPIAGLLMAAPPVLLVALFVGFPIGTAIAYSLGHVGGLNATIALIARDQHTVDAWWQQSVGAYADVLADDRFRRDLLTTVGVTLVTTVVVVGLAWVVALYLRLSGSRAARVLAALAVVPMFIPVVIASWAILTFYAGDGFVRSLAATLGGDAPTLGYTVVCITIAMIWTQLPFATLMIVSGVQAVPGPLIEAAADAGASLPRIVRSVLLPLAMVPTVIAATFTAIGTLGAFTVPYFTGPNAPTMLGVDMAAYFQSYNLPQQAVVVAVVVFLIAAGIGALYVWANLRAARDAGRG
jgi:ABC-type spermidine/putrescine transport system permease subunit I